MTKYSTVGDISPINITEEYVRARLPERPADANKGTFGTAGLIAGSYGMAGAAILSARAAIRSGVGIAKLIIPECIYAVAAPAVPEAVFKFLPQKDGKFDGTAADTPKLLNEVTDGCRAVMLGCGIGTSEGTRALVKAVLNTVKKPLVLDADGINAAVDCIDLIRKRRADTVITPHPGEAARLLGVTAAEIQSSRQAAAREIAEMTQAVTLLKGQNTLIAVPHGDMYICRKGNSGMATAGSGDVLSGIITALICQGLSAEHAAVCGAYIHACAGDISAKQFSQTAMCAGDIINSLPECFLNFEHRGD